MTKALGAYIFAGGFTAGIRSAGFDVLGHLEDGTYGVPSAHLNFPDLPIETDFGAWESSARSFGVRKRIPLIYGNPPCAAWSALNGKKTKAALSWKTDDRVTCTLKHFELLERYDPTVWIWESVDRAFSTGRLFCDELAARAVNAGYAVTHLRFDAQYIGGRHRRQRYFFIAHKVAFDWEALLDFTTAPVAGKVLAKAPKRTAEDKKFIEIPAHHVKAWKSAKPGEALQAAWDRLTPETKRKVRIASTGQRFFVGRPAFKNIKLDPDRVCPTVVGLNLIHPTEPRHLSIGEMKALCGYPTDWRLQPMNGGGRWDLFTRAVMPPVGSWVGGLVAGALDGGKRVKKKVEIVDLRKAKLTVEEVK